jgi:hypothetical protein
MTEVSDILDNLLGSSPSSKTAIINEAIGYLAGYGYTVADGDAKNTDWAIARAAERIHTKRKLHEQSRVDPSLLATLANYNIMTPEIERLLSQTNRKTYVKAYNYTKISTSDNWMNSSS